VNLAGDNTGKGGEGQSENILYKEKADIAFITGVKAI
jgi:hypothetical protein